MYGMNIKKLMIYAFAGKEYEGGVGLGVFEVMLNCLETMSLDPLREYRLLIRGGIIAEKMTERRVSELYKFERNGWNKWVKE